jgi:primosomal protein N' (replication factor Y)
LIRVSRSRGAELARTLAAARAVRSARRETDPVRVRLDPLDLL